MKIQFYYADVRSRSFYYLNYREILKLYRNSCLDAKSSLLSELEL